MGGGEVAEEGVGEGEGVGEERMGEEEEAPKYQLEDILNRKKPPPQILDLYKTQ